MAGGKAGIFPGGQKVKTLPARKLVFMLFYKQPPRQMPRVSFSFGKTIVGDDAACVPVHEGVAFAGAGAVVVQQVGDAAAVAAVG